MSKVFPLILGEKDRRLKIIKIFESINPTNITITQDDKNQKQYKLIQKSTSTSNQKVFTATEYKDLESKYLLFKYNKSSKKMETYPIGSWLEFTRDQVYSNSNDQKNMDFISKEKKIEKMSQVINLFKKKKNKEPPKKQRKTNEKNDKTPPRPRGRPSNNPNTSISRSSNNIRDELPGEDDDIFSQQKKPSNNFYDQDFEDKYSSEEDISLKSAPSYIEDISKSKKNISKEEKLIEDELEKLSKSSESDDSEDKKVEKKDKKSNDENEEDDEDDEDDDDEGSNNDDNDNDIDIDKEFIGMDKAIGHKRERDDAKDKASIFDLMSDSLVSMLSRKSRMTYNEILKEFTREKVFLKEEIENNLSDVLNRFTKTHIEGKVLYYSLRRK